MGSSDCSEHDTGTSDGNYSRLVMQSTDDARVLYCSLGDHLHNYWDKRISSCCLAGIQYALGELKADNSPA